MQLSLRHRLFIVLLVLAVFAAPLLLTRGAPPAEAEGRAVTLSKTTDIIAGEEITVSWSGFRPGPAYLQMCAAGSEGWETYGWRRCAEVTRVEGTTEQDGTGSVQFVAWRSAGSGTLPTPPNVIGGSNSPIPCNNGKASRCDIVVSECGFDVSDGNAAAALVTYTAGGSNPKATLAPPPSTTTTTREAVDPLPTGDPIVGSSASSPFRFVEELQYEALGEPLSLRADITKQNSPNALTSFTEGNVDFAITSLPLDEDQTTTVEEDGRTFAYVPVAASALALAYELRVNGLPVSDMNLDPALLAQMYKGQLTDWKDPAITEANRGCSMQYNNRRYPVSSFRTDVSGANWLFSSWLDSQANEGWGLGVGTNLPIEDSQVFGRIGAEELTKFIAVGDPTNDFSSQATAGRVGFVDRSWAEIWGLPSANLGNNAGEYLSPNDDAAVLKAIEVTDPQPGEVLVPAFDSTEEGAYPLPVVYYALVQTNPTDDFTQENVDDLKALLTFAVSDEGQELADASGFVPLPEALRTQATDAIALIGTSEQQPIPTTTTTSTTTPALESSSAGGFGASPLGSGLDGGTGGGSGSGTGGSTLTGSVDGGEQIAIENAAGSSDEGGIVGAVGSILGNAATVLALPLLLALGLGGVLAGQVLSRTGRKGDSA